ncbi:Hsp70 family protein, partial [Roseateles sp. GG27B]
VLREFGYRSFGPERPGSPAREVPSGIYFDLATWHLINTVYSPLRAAELRNMRSFYGDLRHHQRLMTVLEERLGHELAAPA